MLPWRPERRQGGGTARSVALPPPVRGLNARDALASMKPDDAITLDNWFPEGNYIELRRGFAEHVTGFTDPVESLMEYNGPAARKLFAAAGEDIYDVTTAGALGTAAVTGLTSARWQHTMFTTSGGTFLWACNGADDIRTYNGSTWATQTLTGVAGTSIINVTPHKRRLWLIEKNSSSAWYLATDAISGAATEFDLGPVWKLGGSLQVIAPVSQDSGDGPDDFLAFISDKGEVALYSGTDPANASTWALVGVYRVGQPIGNRSTLRVGGDAIIITNDGIISLLKAMQVDRSATDQASITDRIRELFARRALSFSTLFGWEMTAYPAATRAIVNVPLSATTSEQYVMNTTTGAWCRFTGMHAHCWSLLGEEIYFGGETAVYKADTGTSDNGAPIEGAVKTAFHYYGDRGALKRWTMLRPAITTNGIGAPGFAVDVDFQNRAVTIPVSLNVPDTLWDVAEWDTDSWGDVQTQLVWTGVFGVGRCAAIRMQTQTTLSEMQVSSFDVMFEPATGTTL